MIPTFWAVDIDGEQVTEDSAFFSAMADAVESAKRQAKANGRPFAVYKLVQTHYVEPKTFFRDGVERVQA